MIFLLVVFDLEGTLVNAELFPEVGRRLGNGDLLTEITNLAMNGDLKFEGAFFKRLNLIQGTSIGLIKDICLQLPLFSGVREAVDELKCLNCHLAIFTGSFDLLAKRVVAKLGIRHVLSNKFITERGVIVSARNPVVTPEVKANRLIKLARRLNITLDSCIAVGDGANDIPMMELAGLSIAFNAKKPVEEIADVVIKGEDLRKILPHIKIFKDSKKGNSWKLRGRAIAIRERNVTTVKG